MAVFAGLSAVLAAAGAALAADTAGAVQVANIAVLVVGAAGAAFCARYALLPGRAAVRLTRDGVVDSTHPWRRSFVPWSALVAVSIEPLPGTYPRVLLHVRLADGDPTLVPVQAQFVQGGAQAVVEAIRQHPAYQGRR